MRNITGVEWCILIAIALIVGCILIPGIVSATMKKDQFVDRRDGSGPQPAFANPSEKVDWTYLGTASDGIWRGSVLKTKDPDTGATIYVLLGAERGGIFVLPAEKSK